MFLLTDEHLLLLASTTSTSGLLRQAAQLSGALPVVETDATCVYAGFALIGTRSEELLRRLTALDVSPTVLPRDSCAETNVTGVPGLLVRAVEA